MPKTSCISDMYSQWCTGQPYVQACCSCLTAPLAHLLTPGGAARASLWVDVCRDSEPHDAQLRNLPRGRDNAIPDSP